MKYKCECCNYSTEDKSNFNKHITSRKHKLVESKSGSSLVENYQSVNLVELLRSINERLEKQEKQLNEQKLQIDNIISEIF
jgi:uncharacterized phage infection (PIP) family protein YhgE